MVTSYQTQYRTIRKIKSKTHATHLVEETLEVAFELFVISKITLSRVQYHICKRRFYCLESVSNHHSPSETPVSPTHELWRLSISSCISSLMPFNVQICSNFCREQVYLRELGWRTGPPKRKLCQICAWCRSSFATEEN